MTNRAPRYRCLICAQESRVVATRGPRAVAPEVRDTLANTVIRRPGKHSNHRHPGRVAFEKVPA